MCYIAPLKIRKYLKGFVHKAFAPFSRNSIVLHENYLYPLLEAARSHCYVENTGNKADSLHRRVKQTCEEDIQTAYLKLIMPLLKYQRITCPTLAIDFTDEDFYGMYGDPYLHPWTGEEGVNATYKYAVLSLVGKHKIPLLAVPVHLGMAKDEMMQLFLRVAHTIFRQLYCILLDAGFYGGEVIQALQHEQYVIRAPQNAKVQEYIEATSAHGWKRWTHTIRWCADKTTKKVQTTIVIVRHVRWKDTMIDCSYATNMLLHGMEYVHLYSKRWQIETNFRVEDQVHVKSKSVRIIIRYFYFMISLLLHALWCFFFRTTMAFDTFKIRLANQLLFESLGVTYVDALV